MKNILYIAPYRQTDGWGEAARDFLNAFSLTKHNICSRPIYLNNSNSFYEGDDDFIKECEERSKYTKDFDVIIQKVLPNMFRYIRGAKNIGIITTESSNIQTTPWKVSMDMMDELWCFSSFEKQQINQYSNIGTSETTRILMQPCNIDKYDNINGQNSYILDKYKNKFKFYFIGELISRKGIEKMLLAFHREFSKEEPVEIILKLYKQGLDESQTQELFNSISSSMKETWKIYPNPKDYKREILILGNFPEKELLELHKSCDCFIVASSGEAWCRPAFDALALGNKIVYNRNCGSSEYLDTSCYTETYPVNSIRVPALAADRPIPYLYNGRDEWYEIDTIDLQKKMRLAYENRNVKPEIKGYNSLRDFVNEFSVETIAKTVESYLE